MTHIKRKNPLDLTPSQVQNLLVYCGIGLMIFMLITRFPIDPIWAGMISFMLFGQKLVPWGHREYSSDDEDQEDRPVAKRGSRTTKQSGDDPTDVASNRRHMRLCYSSG